MRAWTQILARCGGRKTGRRAQRGKVDNAN